MVHTLHIDDSDPKAKAFLEFARTLDFVKENAIPLTDDQILAIDKGLESLRKNGGTPHEKVMSAIKGKYPNLFR